MCLQRSRCSRTRSRPSAIRRVLAALAKVFGPKAAPAVPGLIELLKDDNADIRGHAAYANNGPDQGMVGEKRP